MKTLWCGTKEIMGGCNVEEFELLLVTNIGDIHQFLGASIPGICHATCIENSYEIMHKRDTYLVNMSVSEAYEPCSCKSWLDVMNWFWDQIKIAHDEQTAVLVINGSKNFQHLMRQKYPNAAKRWDAYAAAEEEFKD